MEIELKIPTEQYAYIGLKLAHDEVLTEVGIDRAINYYHALKTQYTAFNKMPEGLTDKEMGMIIENMCLQKTTLNGVELWAKATDTQKTEINRLKRALKRIKSKQEPNPEYGDQIIITHEDQL